MCEKGISSGLTVGLIGLDFTKLEVLSKSGTPREQAAARKILPIVSNHHLLLVTLLLATSSAEEAMPLFLERMMPMWASIIVSVILVLIFAEVIPMALCTRYGLDVGAKLSWLVHIFIWVCYPVAYPISKALDWMFGHSAGSLFKRSQLKELIDMHSKHTIQNAEDVEAELAKLPVEDRLTSQEVQLIKNALDLNARTAIELSTPIDEVYMLEYSQICDREVIGSIIHYGLHFCVPVYRDNRDNIVGVIRVSALIELSPDDNTPISALELDAIVKIPSDMPVYRAMTLLQAEKSSLAILSDPQLTRIPVAVLTMEDIVEELVAGQIADIPLFPENREGDPEIMEDWLQQDDGDDIKLEVASTGSASTSGTTVSLPARARPDFFRGHSASAFLPGMRRQTSNSSLVSNDSHVSAVVSVQPPPNSPQPIRVAHASNPKSPGRQSPQPTKNSGFASPPFQVSRNPTPPHYTHGSPLHQQQYLHPNYHPFNSHSQHPHTQLDNALELDRGLVELDDHSGANDVPLRESGKWARTARRGKWVRASAADYETSSNASSVSSNSSNSASSYASQASLISDVHSDHFMASDARSISSASSTGSRLLKVEKRHKDPNVAHKIDKKMTAANVIGTVLKRSSSGVSITAQTPALPIIYKRNKTGDAVVDPSKLLSASYGDIHDIPELNEEPPPTTRVLSASHEAIPQPSEEEMVQLEI